MPGGKEPNIRPKTALLLQGTFPKPGRMSSTGVGKITKGGLVEVLEARRAKNGVLWYHVVRAPRAP